MAHLSLRISLILICLASIQAKGPSGIEYMNQNVHAKQHDDVNLKFITVGSRSKCSFQLSYDHVVFNINGTSIYSEKHSQISKARRTSIRIEKVFAFLYVSLGLRNILPSDAGVYGGQFLCSSGNLSQNTLLRVYHPPDSATCEWTDSPNVPLRAEDLFHRPVRHVLQCTAKNGFPKAEFICYSVENYRTQFHTPYLVTGRAGKGNMTGKFWLSKDIEYSCCSYNQKYTKTKDNCLDYVTHLSASGFSPTKTFTTNREHHGNAEEMQTPSADDVDTITLQTQGNNGIVEPITIYHSKDICSRTMSKYFAISTGILGCAVIVLTLILINMWRLSVK